LWRKRRKRRNGQEKVGKALRTTNKRVIDERVIHEKERKKTMRNEFKLSFIET
jgi:hypothetical protein